MVVAFEGIDGSGKTTLSKKLYKFLKDRGLKVKLLSEPGGTEFGREVKRLLEEFKLEPLTEVFLFNSARLELYKRIKSLKEEVIILDRCYISTYAYQGYGRGVSLKLLKELINSLPYKVDLDFIFYLDLSPEDALKRKVKRGRFEDLNFLKRVREGYLKLQSEYNFISLDATKEPNSLLREVLNYLKEKLPKSVYNSFPPQNLP